ncbi:MAG: hypothetical protein ACRETS_00230, partial [Steroidobacteraceae bacterium]
EQLEPAVDTSAPAPSAAPTRQGAASASASPNSDAGKPQAARRGTQPPKAGAPAAKGPDRVQLETTDITGNRELPKVLYIVPWKRSDLGDLVGKPPNSLLDEVLQPIDRDVFMRENRYYDALKPDAGRPGRGALPAAGEKP